eukprot:COSAG05_NODE_13_length_36464_cov_294.169449_9_plen_360_part_00
MVSLATVAAGIQGAYVAVLAPSAGAAAVFPHMAAQGIRRLEECLGVPAKLMPSAELCGDALTPEVRAADINAAFADPKVVALVSTIGGDEGVRVLPFLDAGVIAANGHKPLLGYSDITSLHLYLWRLGVVSFYGGALLTQFAISGPGMHEYTRDAIRSALLRPSERYSLRASAGFQDGYLNWGDEANMGVAKALEPNLGWHWAGWQPGSPPVSGVLWGGCLEVLVGHFMSRKWTPGPILEERLRGAILFVETSEEFPAACFVYHFFQSLGEIGLLRREVGFAAVLMGRPQTVSGLTGSCGDRVAFKTEQQAAVLRAIAECLLLLLLLLLLLFLLLLFLIFFLRRRFQLASILPVIVTYC